MRKPAAKEHHDIAQTQARTPIKGPHRYHPHLKHFFQPAHELCGDMMLVEQDGKGCEYILLCSIMGHESANTLAAVPPIVQSYYDLAQHACDLNDLVRKLNFMHLPDSITASAVVLALDSQQQRIKIWNGGYPDILVWSESKQQMLSFPSIHAPLVPN